MKSSRIELIRFSMIVRQVSLREKVLLRPKLNAHFGLNLLNRVMVYAVEYAKTAVERKRADFFFFIAPKYSGAKLPICAEQF